MSAACTIDVIVVTWRQRALTLRCLEHLERQTAPFHLIVVDNASGDGTAEAIRSRWPTATMIENTENLGFGRACNVGASHGSAEAIVLVNNDLFVEPTFLAELVRPLENSSVDQVAGVTLIPERQPPVVDSAGILLDSTLAGVNYRRHQPTSGLDVANPPSVPSGGAAAYRRTAFEAVGGFDARLFAYGEDVDLGLRIAALGGTCALAVAARGVHLGGASFGKRSAWQRRLGGTARGFLMRRYAMGRRAQARSLITEGLICIADAGRHRDLEACRGRIAGWRLAKGTRLPVPTGVVDESIGAIASLRMRARQ